MNNPIPNPDVVVSRDGASHRCAKLFDSRDNASASPNCRTLVHYLLGHPLDLPVPDDAARAADACPPDDPARLLAAVDPVTPCLRPATVLLAAAAPR